MHKEDIVRALENYLADLDVCADVPLELLALLSATGDEAAFFSILVRRMHVLNVMGVQITKTKEFENLGGGIFSMHLPTKHLNIRILYSFLSDARPVLLLAFNERAGKRKTDYTPYIEPAKNRLAKMKEE